MKKRTGSKEWRVRLKTWVGRVSADGKRSGWHDLGTDDPALAQERLERWLVTGEPPTLADKESFAVAAERVMDKQEARGEKVVKDRRRRIQAFAIPVIGHIEVGALEPHHVYSVLRRMGEQEQATRQAYAADTVHHLRTDMSRILNELVLEGTLKSNVAREVELPDNVEVDDRPRIVLTDVEINEFRVKRGFERELDMMALFARDLGGHRTSDLHAADYSDFDTVGWKTCVVRRPKTDREGSRKGKRKGRRRATRGYQRDRIDIPGSVLGPLKAWWTAAGCPSTGPVFPLRRGPKAGQRKTGKGISYAQALRDALWEACIYRPLPGFEGAVGDARRQFCALQVDTDETRAVDFHSFRRAYVTALARSGLNHQTAMALSGHTDLATHQRYMAAGVLTVPPAALPGAAAIDPAPVAQQPVTDPAPVAQQLSMEALLALFKLLAAGGNPPLAELFDPRRGQMGSFEPDPKSANSPMITPARPEGFEPST
jgi:integrase